MNIPYRVSTGQALAIPEVVRASTPELKIEAYRLRKLVYVDERCYEHSEDLEYDEFDQYAEHILVRIGEVYVGTTRIIVSNGYMPPYPFCRVYKQWYELPVNWLRTGEISRFSCSKARTKHVSPEQRALIVPMLIKGIAHVSEELGLTHWVQLINLGLMRLLRERWNINLIPCGPHVMFHGKRQPCYGDVRSILQDLKATRRAMWRFVSSV